MEDFIKIDPPPNQTMISGLLVPAAHGTFNVTLVAGARSNGQATPLIWCNLLANKQDIAHSDHIAWENGNGSIQVTGALEVLKGKVYQLKGSAGHENADATGIEMEIQRVA